MHKRKRPKGSTVVRIEKSSDIKVSNITGIDVDTLVDVEESKRVQMDNIQALYTPTYVSQQMIPQVIEILLDDKNLSEETKSKLIRDLTSIRGKDPNSKDSIRVWKDVKNKADAIFQKIVVPVLITVLTTEAKKYLGL